MDYLLSLSDTSQQQMVVLTLPENVVRHSAIDVVIDVIGTDDVQDLVQKNILAPGYVDDFRALQRIIFDRDDQGIFIRENVNFTANGSELNPDAPFQQAFVPAARDGVKYFRSDVIVSQGGLAGGSASGSTGAIGGTVGGDALDQKQLSDLFFLHQICVGRQLDVTKDHLELDDTLKRAEREGLVEVDVKQASYRSTPKGKSKHDAIMAEAQELIKRYDIFCDVDYDSQGTARFDTGLGKDLRVPVYEVDGVNPFRARFLLGLNDGEWDEMEDWTDAVENPKWFESIMAPIERAPSVEDIGQAKIRSIIEQGRAILRDEFQHRSQ